MRLAPQPQAPVDAKAGSTPPAMGAATAVGAAPRRSPPLRVLHVFNRLSVGGTEMGVLKLIAPLRDGFEHRLCTIRGFDPELEVAEGLEGQIFVAGGARGSAFAGLLRVMREYRPHIVHSRNWGAIEAVAAARLARVPVAIHSEHGYEVEMLNGLPWRRRLMRRFTASIADAMFTVANELRYYHADQSRIPLSRIRVIYNGVDTERFIPDAKTRGDMRRRLAIPQECFVIGTVGRLVPIKDQATILKAADRLVRAGVDARVLMVGDGPELHNLRSTAESLPALSGRTLFPGASSIVPGLLNACDVYVLSSLREGMSNTLLEAMACGLPCVATRVGGNPEVVEEGRCGWLFAPGDAEQLSQHLWHLATDARLRHKFGRAARERAAETFALSGMVERYRELYVELAQRRGIETKP